MRPKIFVLFSKTVSDVHGKKKLRTAHELDEMSFVFVCQPLLLKIASALGYVPTESAEPQCS